MANQEKLNAIIDQVLENEAIVVKQKQAVPKQRLRTAAQGLTLGFGDELEAYARAAVSDRSVDEILAEVRGGIKDYQEAYPGEALGYELGGAAATMFIPGGAPSTLGRLALRGAGEGATYAFGTGEGGLGQRASRVPAGVAFGAGGGVVGGKAAQYLGNTLEALVDVARRTTGKRGATIVENEIQRLVEQTGKSPDQIVQEIAEGKILAENRTLAASVKALRGQGGEAAPILQKPLERRPMQLRGNVKKDLATKLDPGASDPTASAMRNQATSETETRLAERAAYKPFENQDVSNEVFIELSSILKNNPDVGAMLNKIAQRQGLQNVYRVDDAGRVMFSRKPTVAEAEKIRRVLSQTARKEFDAKDIDLGVATQDIEKSLRSVLDTSVPDLMNTRAQAAAVRQNREAFLAGRKALTGDVNEVIVNLQDTFAKKPEALASYRSGFLAALQGKFATGQDRSLMRNLLDEGKKEGMLFRELIPDANDQKAIIKKLEMATESEDVAQTVLRNSQTAETMLAKNAQNMGITASEGTAAALGDVNALLSVSRKIVNSFSRELSDKERARIAQILVSEDPEVVRRAITDERGIAKAQELIAKLAPRIRSVGTTIGSREATAPTADLSAKPVQTGAQGVLGLLGAF
tara:strand:- start:9848 stop:11761 length:1914 start_codon:yes stop_codon:yes gene_type:complete